MVKIIEPQSVRKMTVLMKISTKFEAYFESTSAPAAGREKRRRRGRTLAGHKRGGCQETEAMQGRIIKSNRVYTNLVPGHVICLLGGL